MIRHSVYPRRRGVAAVVMIVLLVVVSMIIVGMVLSGARGEDLTVRRMETVQSFYAAEAGMQMAIREVMNSVDEDGDGGIGSISDDADDDTDPVFGSAAVSASVTTGAVSTVTSIGRSGIATRKQQVEISAGGAGTAPGLIAAYFVLNPPVSSTLDVDWDAAPDHTAVVTRIDFNSTSGAFWFGGPSEDFAVRYQGSVEVAQGGTWRFYTRSDDGSRLYINGTEVVNNDGLHGMSTQSGTIVLTAGKHTIDVTFFERGGGAGIIVYWSGPGVASQTVIPASAFFH